MRKSVLVVLAVLAVLAWVGAGVATVLGAGYALFNDAGGNKPSPELTFATRGLAIAGTVLALAFFWGSMV